MKKATNTVLGALLCAALLVSPAAAQEKAAAAECVGGSPDSPARIEVYSDFQCPACQTFYLRTMRQVLADYAMKNKVCVVYHEFPVSSIHPYARAAARFAAAARRLGNDQWIRVADRLFVDQAVWSASGNVEATVKKALSDEDFSKLLTILKDPSIDAEIDRDMALAQQKGVRSTPTYFVITGEREQKAVGATQYQILKRYLDSVLP